MLNSGKDELAYITTRHITKEGGIHHDGHNHVGSFFKDKHKLSDNPVVLRSAEDALIHGDDAARVENEVDASLELHRLLTGYCTERTRKGVQFLCVHGWLRLVRDLEVLDNKLALGSAVAIFEDANDLVTRPGRNGNKTELKADAKAFRRMLTHLAQMRYPSSANPLQALIAWHAPLARGAPHTSRYRHPEPGVAMYPVGYDGDVVTPGDAPPPPPPVVGDELDDIASLEACALLKKYRAPLRRVYAHYCTLSLISCVYSTWPHVKGANRAMREGEFLRLLSDFYATPLLLERQECISAFRAANRDAELTDRPAKAVGSFPQFCEALLRCALRCASSLPKRLSSTKTACTEAVASMRLGDMSDDLHARRKLETCFDRRRQKMGMATAQRIGTTDEDFIARAELALETQRKNEQLKSLQEMPVKERMRRTEMKRQKEAREAAAARPPLPQIIGIHGPVAPPISLDVVIGGPSKTQSRSPMVTLGDFIDGDRGEAELRGDSRGSQLSAFERLNSTRTFANAEAEMKGWHALPDPAASPHLPGFGRHGEKTNGDLFGEEL
ncbi:hypothetical protein RI054_35g135100 [Pseudoscourfieldia marina]